MDSSRWQQLWKLFDQALEQNPAQREAWVDAACSGDADMAAEVKRLIAAAALQGAILDHPPATISESDTLQPGDCIDRYRIISGLGQGGMGSVYLVERIDGEFRQQAALKVIAPGHAHPVLVERFRRERQIMASLDHPGIARLLDGGHTQNGWPYLVMDYVEGEPIDAYCQRLQLGLSERLRLLAEVCDAVDYAHRRLIVHRDLKPGNILVGALGNPVLLDFGIAKLIDPDASDDATALSGLRPYTPGYAAPEQLEGEPIGVAADVFGLGVLLYELVSGKRPFDEPSKNPQRIAEQIRRQQIPSLRSASSTASKPQPVGIELDWIVRRALKADPEQRYADAADLARDLRALLQHRPVSARPDSFAYRAGKFCRRHWLGVGISVAFVATVVGFGLQLRLESQRTALALAQSSTERDRQLAVADFLRDLFRAADSTRSAGAEVSAVELLDRGRAALELRSDLTPRTRLTLLRTLAEVYRNMGRYEEATALLENAQATAGDGDVRERVALLADLGAVMHLRGQYSQSLDALEDALRLCLDAQLEPAIESLIRLRLGQALQSLGEHDRAGTAFTRGYDIRFANLPADDPLIADAALRLGSWHWIGGRLDQAESWYARALAMRRAAAETDLPELARALDAFAAVRHARGDFEQGVSVYREAIQLRRRVLGNQHLHTANSLSNLGAVLYDLGSDAEAEIALREALAIYQQVAEPGSTSLAMTMNNLALVRQRSGARAQALDLFEQALAINLAAFGEEHRLVAGNLNNLGILSEQLGDLDAAESYLRRAIAGQEAALGPDHANVAFGLGNLGRVLLWRGQTVAAVQMLERATTIRRLTLLADHPLQAETMSWLGYARCVVQGKHGEGQRMLERALALRQSELEGAAVATEESRALLGSCLLAAGQPELAAQTLAIALPRLRSHWATTSPGWKMLIAAQQSIRR